MPFPPLLQSPTAREKKSRRKPDRPTRNPKSEKTKPAVCCMFFFVSAGKENETMGKKLARAIRLDADAGLTPMPALSVVPIYQRSLVSITFQG